MLRGSRAETRRRLAVAAIALIAATSAVEAPGARAAEPSAAPTPSWPQTETLSEPGQLSRWAFVQHATVVRSAPSWTAKHIAKLRLYTQDRTDELVLLLERTVDPDGRRWVRVRLPVRPNNTTGWVPQSALAGFRRVFTWLKIDRRRLRATLIRRGRVVFRAPIGIGQPRWPTPRGEFYVRNRLSGFGSGSIYGALAFGLSATSDVLTDWPGGGVIGVHGTNRPGLIPGRPSHGCIRMRNRDILRLDRLMPVGTPVTIR